VEVKQRVVDRMDPRRLVQLIASDDDDRPGFGRSFADPARMFGRTLQGIVVELFPDAAPGLRIRVPAFVPGRVAREPRLAEGDEFGAPGRGLANLPARLV